MPSYRKSDKSFFCLLLSQLYLLGGVTPPFRFNGFLKPGSDEKLSIVSVGLVDEDCKGVPTDLLFIYLGLKNKKKVYKWDA